MAEWQRSHTCGDLRVDHVGQTVTLNGWVLITRNYPAQTFVDLRDRYGLTQVVFDSDNAAAFAAANGLGREHVVSVTGVVRKRLPGATRPGIATGEVEVLARTLRVLNTCPPLPFSVTEFPDEVPANEDLRLQYRYLDLRRRSIQQVLMLRHRVCKIIRDYMDVRGFLEMETPLLGKSTPEGARDYLVPSRVSHGEWYALPQSPQLYKQLLMISGYDKYFQIAKCLRDEDLRADRQPEFTQLDVEMSFVEQDDILTLMEGLAAEMVQKILGVTLQLPLARLSYSEAMRRFGSDKPDLRFGMEIVDATDLFSGEEETYKLFREAVDSGKRVRAINAKGAAKHKLFTSKGRNDLIAYAKQLGASGLGFALFSDGTVNSPFWSSIPESMRIAIVERLECSDGDAVIFMTGSEDLSAQVLGTMRSYLATELKLYRNWWDEKAEHDVLEEKAAKKEKRAPKPFAVRPEHLAMLWVVDFPMFAWNDEEKSWAANHHPFTSPRDEDLAHLESDPGKVLAKAYDMVLNGYEVGGGSIRIHRPDVQERVFKMLGMELDEAKQRFGFLLDALQSGAPPHGGIALGLDRWCMTLAGTTNIRDVIAFPKNQKARDLMTGAPAAVDARQLKDLGVKPA